jgi:putative addiction module killer protein
MYELAYTHSETKDGIVVFFKTDEFVKWYGQQTEKTQYLIESRLKRISTDDHWGFINKFDGLIELKWTSGLRIYTAKINNVMVVILLGGNKNGQNKDIKKAKAILEKLKGSHFS